MMNEARSIIETQTDDVRCIARESGPARRVAEAVEPVLEHLGFCLVRVRLTGEAGQTLQIMLERPDGTLSIDDCEQVSRAISPVLDVADPVAGPYRLEVSSPGIDRPLVRARDFETWAGFAAKIEMINPVAGRKRFRGVLEGCVDGEARLYVDDDAGGQILIGLPLAEIAGARLVVSDEMLNTMKSKPAAVPAQTRERAE